MTSKIQVKYDTLVQKQEYYLQLLNVISKFGLTNKQLDALTYLCIHAKETRAITDTVKKKCRESLGCSASSFSNLLKALNEVNGLINDDILHRYLFVPKELKEIKLYFIKNEVPLATNKEVINEVPVNSVDFINDNTQHTDDFNANSQKQEKITSNTHYTNVLPTTSNNDITDTSDDGVQSLSSATINRSANEIG